MDLRNAGILPQLYTASQPKRLKMEAAFGILPQHHTASQPGRSRCELRYTTTDHDGGMKSHKK